MKEIKIIPKKGMPIKKSLLFGQLTTSKNAGNLVGRTLGSFELLRVRIFFQGITQLHRPQDLGGKKLIISSAKPPNRTAAADLRTGLRFPANPLAKITLTAEQQSETLARNRAPRTGPAVSLNSGQGVDRADCHRNSHAVDVLSLSLRAPIPP